MQTIFVRKRVIILGHSFDGIQGTVPYGVVRLIGISLLFSVFQNLRMYIRTYKRT